MKKLVFIFLMVLSLKTNAQFFLYSNTLNPSICRGVPNILNLIALDGKYPIKNIVLESSDCEIKQLDYGGNYEVTTNSKLDICNIYVYKILGKTKNLIRSYQFDIIAPPIKVRIFENFKSGDTIELPQLLNSQKVLSIEYHGLGIMCPTPKFKVKSFNVTIYRDDSLVHHIKNNNENFELKTKEIIIQLKNGDRVSFNKIVCEFPTGVIKELDDLFFYIK